MTVSTLAYGDPYEYKQYTLDTVQDYIWWLEDRVYGRNVFGAGYGYLWIWDMAGPPPAFLWEGDIFAFIPGTNMGEYIMGPVEDLDPKKYLPAPTYADGVPQIGGSGA